MSDFVKNYNQFSIQIMDTDNDVNLLEGTDCELKYFKVNYQPMEIPTIELKIKSYNQANNMNDLKNISVSIIMEDLEAFSYNIGVDSNYMDNDNYMTIKGYLCNYDDFVNYESMYLGSNIKDALLSLNIRKNFVGEFDEINYDYWQIEETKTQVFLRLLRQCAKNSLFSITENDVKIIRLDNLSKDNAKEYIPYSKINYFLRDNRIKSLLESEFSNVLVSDEKSNLSMVSTMGKNLINISENSNALSNYGYSIINKNILSDTTFSLHYNNKLFEYDIGDLMTCESNFYVGSSLLILNKIIFFGNDNIYTDVLMCGVSLDEEE